MMLVRWLAVAALLCTGRPSIAGDVAFAVQVKDGPFMQYRVEQPMQIADRVLDATVVRLSGDEWELTLAPKDEAISAVWFPWAPDRTTSAPDLRVAAVYYPFLLGVAVKASLLTEWGWQGNVYPGGCFAPLVVLADDTDARMVAATNWPPRRVTPMYSLGRIGLRYDEHLDPGARRSYRALVVHGRSTRWEPSWQRAVDVYKNWLKAHLAAAGLQPSYPSWMRSIHGWLNVQLENMPVWEAARVEATWQRWKSSLPWMQFWGQMSGYYTRGLSRPEEAGCCLDTPHLHRRYEPGLVRLARVVRQEGHVGFYARPRSPYAPLVSPETAAPTEEWKILAEWLERNRSKYGANAVYLDVVGGRDFGDPFRVATLLKKEFDGGTVIERGVDLYPTAFLASGALGGGSWQGGPERTRAQVDGTLTRTTFPSFGRYVLDDRVLFLGESNGDGRWWGSGGNYWTERQAFLLGAKFDVIRTTENGQPDGPANPALSSAIAARNANKWWERDPVYLDRRGLDQIPADVDIRRFRGRSGETLLVVDNWHARRDLRVTIDDRSQALPDDRLSIVVLPGPG